MNPHSADGPKSARGPARRSGPAEAVRRSLGGGLAASLALLVALPAPAGGRSLAGLAYSSASPRVLQRQPSPGSCHERGSGLYARPDLRCTPGALNPAVTPSTVGSTICHAGWTASVRPPESVTEPEKLASLRAYGLPGALSRYEYDHLVPLELGGAVNDARNLWPEPDYATRAGFYLNPKDRLENSLKHLVCARRMSLSDAQRLIAGDWVAAYRRFG